MIMDEGIKTIRDIIVKTVPIEKLYLFGSYAYGNPNKDSDYDFYMVMPNNTLMRPLDAITEVYMAMGQMKRKSVDLLANTQERFDKRSKQITLEREVATKGVLLYEQ